MTALSICPRYVRWESEALCPLRAALERFAPLPSLNDPELALPVCSRDPMTETSFLLMLNRRTTSKYTEHGRRERGGYTAMKLKAPNLLFALRLLMPIILLSLGAAAQTATLSGTATDAKGKPIANATVSIKAEAGPNPIEVHTDADGNYSIPNLAPGDYSISASGEGLASKTIKVTITTVAASDPRLVVDAAPEQQKPAQELPNAPTSAPPPAPASPSLEDLGFSSAADAGERAVAGHARKAHAHAEDPSETRPDHDDSNGRGRDHRPHGEGQRQERRGHQRAHHGQPRCARGAGWRDDRALLHGCLLCDRRAARAGHEQARRHSLARGAGFRARPGHDPDSDLGRDGLQPGEQRRESPAASLRSTARWRTLRPQPTARRSLPCPGRFTGSSGRRNELEIPACVPVASGRDGSAGGHAMGSGSVDAQLSHVASHAPGGRRESRGQRQRHLPRRPVQLPDRRSGQIVRLRRHQPRPAHAGVHARRAIPDGGGADEFS